MAGVLNRTRLVCCDVIVRRWDTNPIDSLCAGHPSESMDKADRPLTLIGIVVVAQLGCWRDPGIRQFGV